MREYRLDNIETCPVQTLRDESLSLLKQVCKEKMLQQSLVSAEEEASKLERKLLTLDARIQNGYQLILSRLKKRV